MNACTVLIIRNLSKFIKEFLNDKFWNDFDPEAENEDERGEDDGTPNDEGAPPAQSVQEERRGDESEDSKAPLEGQVFGEEEEADEEGNREPSTNTKSGSHASAVKEKHRAKPAEKSNGNAGDGDEDMRDGTPDGDKGEEAGSAREEDESASVLSEPLDSDPYYAADGKPGREEAPDQTRSAEEEINDLELPDQLHLDDAREEEGAAAEGEGVEGETQMEEEDREEEANPGMAFYTDKYTRTSIVVY